MGRRWLGWLLSFFRHLSFLSQSKLLIRACLHGDWEPQVGEVKYGGSPHLSCKHDQIKMRDYMDKRVTPPKRATSCTWGPPPPTGPKSSLPMAIFANCANCWSSNSSQIFQTDLYGLSLQNSSAVALLMLSIG